MCAIWQQQFSCFLRDAVILEGFRDAAPGVYSAWRIDLAWAKRAAPTIADSEFSVASGDFFFDPGEEVF